MAKKEGKKLGRGLSALLGRENARGNDAAKPKPLSAKPVVATDQTSRIENVYPGRYQPRQTFGNTEMEELAGSIKALGVLQPILVRPHPEKVGCYEILAGERRWRAAQLAQLHEVPILIREFSDVEALEIGLVENLQRENLSPIEEAEGYQRLMEEFAHTQGELAKAVGKSRSHVANMMRLLNLPEIVKEMLLSGKLTVGHARALLNSSNPTEVAKKIVSRSLSVRQTETLCKTLSVKKDFVEPGKRASSVNKDVNILVLETEISSLLGLKVQIDFKMTGGKVNIFYDTLEQLDNVLYRISEGRHGKASSSDLSKAP
jgi:ParB family chromosome partitioning protein